MDRSQKASGQITCSGEGERPWRCVKMAAVGEMEEGASSPQESRQGSRIRGKQSSILNTLSLRYLRCYLSDENVNLGISRKSQELDADRI